MRTILKSTTDISINDNVICDTSYLGIVRISGEDALTFLQGQFSNDVNLLDGTNSQFNSYNSPKGRMYASFRLYKQNDDFFMLLPKEIIEPILKRLRMFVMRSKVVLDDLTESWASVGLSGSAVTDIKHFPKTADTASHNDELTYLHIPGIENRLIVIGTTEKIEAFKKDIGSNFIQTNDDHWKRLDIHAGLPSIYPATQETFVAQMVNLPQVNGVSFTKGCYPGQEVVARMHYLGKLKKRMYRIIIEGQTVPTPGDNLYYSDNENTQSIGQIVDAQLNDSDGIDALAVVQVKAADKGDIHLSNANGPAVSFSDLPYTFE